MSPELSDSCDGTLKQLDVLLRSCRTFLINKTIGNIHISHTLRTYGVKTDCQYLRYRLGEVRANLMFITLLAKDNSSTKPPSGSPSISGSSSQHDSNSASLSLIALAVNNNDHGVDTVAARPAADAAAAAVADDGAAAGGHDGTTIVNPRASIINNRRRSVIVWQQPNQIPRLKYRDFDVIKRTYARGGYSCVFRALYTENRSKNSSQRNSDTNDNKIYNATTVPVALKVLNAKADTLYAEKGVMDELRTHYNLQSPYVARCLGLTVVKNTSTKAFASGNGKRNTEEESDDVTCDDEDDSDDEDDDYDDDHGLLNKKNNGNLAIAIEFMQGGALSTLLASDDYKTLSAAGRVWLALQVSLALQYLHSKNTVHGDIKPLNFLWTVSDAGTKPVVKVSDFGNAKLHHTMQSLSANKLALGSGADAGTLCKNLRRTNCCYINVLELLHVSI